jgi:hypothetical protein
MKRRLHLIAAALFVLALLYDFYLWGGLARVPGLGPIMLQTTQREVALAGIYLPVGLALVDATGLSGAAAASAAESFSTAQARVLANPDAAMDAILEAMPPDVAAAYYGAPVLLLVFAVLWWRRPRVVHMMRSR